LSELYKVLIFGARDWSEFGPIRREIKKLIKKHGTDNLLIIEGECPNGGADVIARIIGHELSVHVAKVPALWETRYRSAGPQRNEITRLMDPDEAIGFHEDLRKSKGTKDMYKRLQRAGIPVRILTK
jgi:hypothetical protein